MGDGLIANLKQQGAGALALAMLAIISVLGIVVLEQFRIVKHGIAGLGAGNHSASINATTDVAITAFIAGLALFGTFATLIALIIVVRGIIGVVRGLN